eukprot:15363275-Ditylum_brightwellii.AAC.1
MKLSIGALSFFLASGANSIANSQQLMSTESSSDACGGALDQARHLDMPAATSVTKGEVEHLEFWSNNGQLLRNAWKEYEGVLGNTIDDDSSGETGLPPKCIHPALATAVNRTWDSPNLKNEEI